MKNDISEADYMLYREYGDLVLDNESPRKYRVEYQAWLAEHVAEPSRILGIPGILVEVMLYQFVPHQPRGVRYTGCTQSVLVNEGVYQFGEKVWQDRNIILPLLDIPPQDHREMSEQIAACASTIFDRVHGVTCEASCRVCAKTPIRMWCDGVPMAKLQYTLTERGRVLQAVDPVYTRELYAPEWSRLSTTFSVESRYTRTRSQCGNWSNEQPGEPLMYRLKEPGKALVLAAPKCKDVPPVNHGQRSSIEGATKFRWEGVPTKRKGSLRIFFGF